MRYTDIDWGLLWQQAQDEAGWKPREARVWDERAASFAERGTHSTFERQCLELLAPQAEWTVLDVGAGPGTLAVPLAAQVRHVTCMDFSAAMLAKARQRAEEEGRVNLSTVHASWSDDWEALGIAPHDVIIAARSLSVRDIMAALRRLSVYGIRKRVVVDRVGSGPFDPAAFAAVGRQPRRGPDYIYTLNALYQLGYHATLAYVYTDNSRCCSSLEEACASYSWMLPDLNRQEQKDLLSYLRSIGTRQEDGSILLQPKHRPTWAFISW
ncbi:MAG: class I SAM-dependent methyltransferase [Desulfobulbaceae bacterium]|nr:class I SAM-dependent methyltransferase [Desulfobulbaceae bacterium]